MWWWQWISVDALSGCSEICAALPSLILTQPHHARRRVAELEAKEKAKVNDLLATLGLKPGQRVTIPPRQPPPPGPG